MLFTLANNSQLYTTELGILRLDKRKHWSKHKTDALALSLLLTE